MKTTMVAMVSLLLISIPLAAAQSDTDLSIPSVMPDSPFYGISRGFEGLQLFFTFDDVDKANLYYRFAGYRLVEAKQMALKNRVQLAEKALADYENELNQTDSLMEKAIARGRNVTAITEKINNENYKHFVEMTNITVTLENRSATITVPAKFAEKFFDKIERLENRTGTMTGIKADRAAEAIDAAKAEIEKASLLNLTNVSLHLLENAENHLKDAEEAFENGYYGRAFGQAIATKVLAINAQRIFGFITPGNETEGEHMEENQTQNETGNESQNRVGQVI